MTTTLSNLATTYNLGKWPVKVAGPVPTDTQIHHAHALLMAAKGGRLRMGAAENLAVAAYLRPADVCVNPLHVAKALSACLGVTATNPRNNVVRIILGATAKGREVGGGKQLVELTTTPGHIKPTALGLKAIERFAPPVEAPKPVDAVEQPKATAKPKAPRKPKIKPAVTADEAKPVEATLPQPPTETAPASL